MPDRPYGYSYFESPATVATEVRDELGNVIVSGETDGDITGDALTEFIQYGVWNGSFSYGPALGSNCDIDSNDEQRRLPYWTGPVSVSGGAITAQWVTSSLTPSGYALQLSLAPGAAGDEIYFEQIVPIGGSARNYLGHTVAVTFVGGVIATSISLKTQYLDVTRATVGATTTTNSGALSGYPIRGSVVSQVGSAGQTARLLRIRIHYLRDAAVASASESVIVADVRVTPVPVGLMLAEVSSFDIPTTPGTPPTNLHSIYAKSADSLLYSKNDAGTEFKMSLVSGTDYAAGGAITASGLTMSTAKVLARDTAGTGAVEEQSTVGSGNFVRATSPTLVTPALGTPTALVLTSATGLPLGGMSNLAANSIIGNNTGSPATPLALTASQVRTLLALVIGTNVQAWDADLDTLAAATVTTGTFTPTLAFATPSTSSWAVTTQLGWYTRLLDRVIFNFFYQGVPSGYGAAAGNLQLTGLPVTSQNTASSGARFSVEFQGYTKANFTQITGFVNVNTTIATFRASGSGQTTAALTVTDIPTGGTVIVSGGGHYLI